MSVSFPQPSSRPSAATPSSIPNTVENILRKFGYNGGPLPWLNNIPLDRLRFEAICSLPTTREERLSDLFLEVLQYGAASKEETEKLSDLYINNNFDRQLVKGIGRE